jgi:PKD repeat protein
MNQRSSVTRVGTRARLLVAIFMVSAICGPAAVFAVLVTTHLQQAQGPSFYQYIGQVEACEAEGTAEWVPILMYHGVAEEFARSVPDPEGINMSIDKFVDQMETLKRNGYETISLYDYMDFRAGTSQLPAKPVIITFDDGRKDSYYNTDDVLKDLGFKATMFVLTGAAPEKDGDFFLSWQELTRMRDSGRWDIEAHGHLSQDAVGKGYFLVTKMDGESDEEYAQRVEEDYRNCVNSLRERLGIDPAFYAIPFCDYGIVSSESSYSGAYELNISLTMKYFTLALGLAEGADIRNTADRDPKDIVRIRVGDISGEELLSKMTIEQPENISVTEDDADTATDTTPPVQNVTPTAEAGPDRTTNEGLPVTLAGSLTESDADTPTILWDFGDGSSASGTLTPTHTYADNGVYTVILTVRDSAGEESTDAATVNVRNVAPVVDVGPVAFVNEGGTFTSSGCFVDLGNDTWTATVDYGDDGDRETLALNPNKTFALGHVYADSGMYRVTVSVTDDDGEVGTAITAVWSFNVAPVVDAGSGATVNEGSTLLGSGSFIDPGADQWSAIVDYGDGTAPEALTLSPNKAFALSHVYMDSGIYTLTVTIWDDDRGTGSDTMTVTVSNVAPTVNAGPDATVEDGQTFVGSGSFTDPGADTWTATVDYGDGSGAQNLDLASGTFTLNHTYTTPGTYTVTVTVADKDGGMTVDTLTVEVEFSFLGLFN